MINVLAIDTSTNFVTCGIARVSLRGTVDVLAERAVDNFRGHMEILTPNILECLAEAGLRPADVHSVVVGAGPGPFTGLRVGMATGAAFADALGVPVHGVPSLLATAWQHVEDAPLVGSAPRDVVVLADARRREWYHARYRLQAGAAGVELTTVLPPAVSRPDDVDVSGAEVLGIIDAHPTALGLLRAAMATEHSAVGLLRHPDPPRALYLRRPDAVVPKAKPVSAAVNSAAVREEDKAANQRFDVAGDGGGAEADVPLGLRVEALHPCHAPLVAELEKQLFADEAPWSAETVRMAIGTPFTSFMGLFSGADLIGYADFALLGSWEDPECEIQNIAIAPEHQGKGYAALLMEPMLQMADAVGAPIYLEVRTDNQPAVGLYRKYGFAVEGTRKGYYQPSGADAYTMQRAAVIAPAAVEDDRQLILGVESSCDETAVGVIQITGERLAIVADEVASSMTEHARFGGVVPEIASRAHLESMQPVMRAALAQAGIAKPTAVAATIGPGLAGALLVGAAAAKAYAAAWEVPFYAVNHLGGHVAVDTLVDGVEAAALDNAIALLVSGGHTQILHVQGVGQPMEELGSTLDDAAGEAYDKVARLLGLGYPGGPIIDRLAAQGNPQAINFPRGMMRPQDSRYDFSFSGLKTAVARYVEQAEKEGQTIAVEDICASFQEAAVDVLTKKALRACEDKGAKVLLLGGGVSANRRLRDLAAQRCREAGVELHVPPLKLCTDNGVMIAALASHLILAGAEASSLGVATDPSLEVETPLVG